MTVAADLAAIESDPTKTADEKRAAKYQIKCQSLATALASVVGKSYAYDGVTYRLYAAKAVQENGTWLLWIVFTAQRIVDGVWLTPLYDAQGKLNEHKFVNPPILTADKTENLVAAAREMLAMS